MAICDPQSVGTGATIPFPLLPNLTIMDIKNTYIAFDASGMINHEFSNLHTFLQFDRYQATYPNRFNFINMDEIKFASEHDGQITASLEQRFFKRMAEADNVLVVASPLINVESDILNWQIRTAVYRYRLPLIIAYAHHDHFSEEEIQTHYVWLPHAVREMVEGDHAYVAHIPLTIDKLERALRSFSVRDHTYPWTSTTVF